MTVVFRIFKTGILISVAGTFRAVLPIAGPRLVPQILGLVEAHVLVLRPHLNPVVSDQFRPDGSAKEVGRVDRGVGTDRIEDVRRLRLIIEVVLPAIDDLVLVCASLVGIYIIKVRDTERAWRIAHGHHDRLSGVLVLSGPLVTGQHLLDDRIVVRHVDRRERHLKPRQPLVRIPCRRFAEQHIVPAGRKDGGGIVRVIAAIQNLEHSAEIGGGDRRSRQLQPQTGIAARFALDQVGREEGRIGPVGCRLVGRLKVHIDVRRRHGTVQRERHREIFTLAHPVDVTHDIGAALAAVLRDAAGNRAGNVVRLPVLHVDRIGGGGPARWTPNLNDCRHETGCRRRIDDRNRNHAADIWLELVGGRQEVLAVVAPHLDGIILIRAVSLKVAEGIRQLDLKGCDVLAVAPHLKPRIFRVGKFGDIVFVDFRDFRLLIRERNVKRINLIEEIGSAGWTYD